MIPGRNRGFREPANHPGHAVSLPLSPNDWQGAEIAAIERASSNILKVAIRPDVMVPFRAGQHIDVRLTAEDGYQASRSYSISAAPGQGDTYDLLIERLVDGEVSGFFHEAAEPGARLEIKGPIGGHFVWASPQSGSILLVAGGSGIAPILSMVRHRNKSETSAKIRLVYATRFAHELVALDELLEASSMDQQFQLRIFLSRETETSPHWRNERISHSALAEFVTQPDAAPEVAFVCGSNSFAEAAIEALVKAGLPKEILRVERFGDAIT